MENNLVYTTRDRSHTLFNERIGEHYHSTFGAVQESRHVFIEAGLEYIKTKDSSFQVFEVGFGTGLNALLTYAWAEKNKIPVYYQSVEAFPISLETAAKLNYPEHFGQPRDMFMEMHRASPSKTTISAYFELHKHIIPLQELQLPASTFHLVYFDAFSPDAQPEMWTSAVFKKIAAAMKRGGVLTTYSCKGSVKRALKSAGLEIEKLPGPEGKREILRGVKK